MRSYQIRKKRFLEKKQINKTKNKKQKKEKRNVKVLIK